jgi:hypothetical protein
MRKSIFVCVLAGAMLGGLAAPAHAGPSEDGTRSCGQNQTGRTHSDTTGFTEHYPPGTGYKAFSNGSTRQDRQAYANSNGGGFWFVETSGAMWNAGTYAVCVTTGPV